ncbi:MAG: inositol monophosphatase family protein [Patescibacteria group bacterium]
MKEVAIKAAKKGGEVVAHFFEMVGLEREVKQDTTFVTEADKKTEAAIIEVIKKEFPNHGFLGEEGGSENENAEYVWVIDPIDGTGNFVNGIPIFAISIALLKKGEPVLGVIYNPITNSLYVGEKGKGVTYNGKSVSVSSQDASKGALTFGYATKGKERAFELLGEARKHFRTVRLLGSAVLDLAYVARGGTEAMVGISLNTWDYAAGVLLVQEAGGVVTTHDGGEWRFGDGSFLASNKKTHDTLVSFVGSI